MLGGLTFNQLYGVIILALHITYLAVDLVSHARTKHIEIYIHFVRDLVAKKTLFIYHILASSQIADVMTKPLSATVFHKLYCCFTHELEGG